MGKWGKVTVMQTWMLCRIFIWWIFCRVVKNVVVVEDELNLGDEKVSELVSSDTSFEGEISDKF